MTPSDDPPAAPGLQTSRGVSLRNRGIGLVFAFFVTDGLLSTLYEYFGSQATGSDRSFLDSLGSETTGSLATAITFFLLVVPVSRRWPFRGAGWARMVPVHLVALVAFSAVKTFLMWALRVPIWPILGLGGYEYGNLLYRIPMEGAGDVLGYVLLTAAVHTWDGWKRWKEEEVRSAQLESQLTSARLDALRDGLQPHFFFNTLNTIGAMVHDDPENADRMITRLSDLLRRALDAPANDRVTVREEIAFVQEYLDIMLVRFADRANVSVEVDDDVAEALLPPFVVQPLVENAFKYGIQPRTTPGAVSISVKATGTELEVQVEDDGPGRPGSHAAPGMGVGLANVRDRLQLLYGGAGSLTVSQRAEGGARVALRTPLVFEQHPTDDAMGTQ